MPTNKISAIALAALYPEIPISLPGGQTFVLPVGQGIVGTFGSVLSPQLAAGNPLTGQYIINLGQYSTLQMFDPLLQYWRNLQPVAGGLVTASADGANLRIANTTGCPVGGIITTAGSAYTNGWYGYAQTNLTLPGGTTVATLSPYIIANGFPTAGNTTFTATASAGGSLWNMIVGGGVNTTIGVSGTLFQNGAFGGTGTSVTGSGGAGYLRPPIIVFGPPSNQGAQPYILPAAVCTISGGAVNAVTVTQQGAGLLGLPSITVVPQFGDPGSGAVLGWTAGNSSQVGSGTLMAIYPAYYGTAQTSVPTFTFSPASTTAVTMIMNFTITGFTNTTPGAGYGNNPGGVIIGGIVAGSAANTNPLYDKALLIPVAPPINVANTTATPSLAGPFQGYGYQAAPTYVAVLNNTTAQSTVAVQPPTVGGANDTVTLIPF